MWGRSDYRLVGFLVAALLLLGIGYMATTGQDGPDRPDPLSPEALREVVGPPSQLVDRRVRLFKAGFRAAAEVQAGDETVTIEVKQIGSLVVRSGRLAVLDPYLLFPEPPALAIEVAPGSYPVDISIAHRPNGDQRIALARIRFLDETIALWQMAVFEDQLLEDLVAARQIAGYGIDAGAGAFVDHDTAMLLFRRRQTSENDPTAAIRSVARSVYVATRDWAVVDVPDASGTNVAAFSGFKDGFYVSYWGYDAAGRIAALVTDFDLLGDHEARDDEGG